MGGKADLTGQIFGKWTVLSESDKRSRNGSVYWLCQCACGFQKLVMSASLLQGNSHGCYRCAHVNRTNQYLILHNGSTRVLCKNKQNFVINTTDLTLVKKYQFWIDQRGYVKTKINGKSEFLSRLLMRVEHRGRDVFVDHISGDTRDNRRSNLRVCQPADNAKNKGLSKNNKTGYKGVSYHSQLKKYRADIRSDENKTIYLGCFDTAQQAAEAYDEAALKLHGEFARTNTNLQRMVELSENSQAI